MEQEWLSEPEVIKILGVTRQTIYTLRQKNVLAAYKYKGKLRYLKADIDAYVQYRNTPQLQNHAVTAFKPEQPKQAAVVNVLSASDDDYFI